MCSLLPGSCCPTIQPCARQSAALLPYLHKRRHNALRALGQELLAPPLVEEARHSDAPLQLRLHDGGGRAAARLQQGAQRQQRADHRLQLPPARPQRMAGAAALSIRGGKRE